MLGCLTDEQIEGLCEGALPEAESQLLQAHLEDCDSCQQRVDLFRKGQGHPEGVKPGPQDRQNTMTTAGPAKSGRQPSAVSHIQIPGYEIVRELHRGGQGVVYQAIQKDTKRKVAIKILLEGPYASESAKKRFEREIELVASLRHPNIISIFHSGQTRDHRPFYVMDYVRGVPLNQYVRDKKLAMEDALKLFAKVCDGVNYAHRRAVIHRDLKPSNILVDSDGEPKVLDFGLAKTVGGSEMTLVSMTGQVVGTLPYMSPEQAGGNPDEIDIRTDIYALGVILYEALTGHYPYPVIGQAADVLRHIAETPPTPPSKAWRPESGVHQRSGKKRVSRTGCPIDDEVQTIVLKALAKEVDRRYQSAGALADDVNRYLLDEPIEAKRDSGLYVLKKTLARYKAAVAVAAGGVIILTLFAITTTIQSATIASERDTARQARNLAEQARSDEEKQRVLAEVNLLRANEAEKQAAADRDAAQNERNRAQEAEQQADAEARRAGSEAEKSQQVVAFLQDMLGAVDPEKGKGANVSVRQVLDEAAKKIDTELADQPEVQAAIHHTIGVTYGGLRLYDLAQKHLRTALAMRRELLGDEHLDVATTLLYLGAYAGVEDE